MKRDMELVKQILLAIEDRADTNHLYEIEGYSEEEITYHARIMSQRELIEIGIIDVSTRDSGMKKEYILGAVGGLTWEGHEFLAAARNDTAWNKAKDTAEEKGLELPYEVFKTLLMTILKSMVLPGQ